MGQRAQGDQVGRHHFAEHVGELAIGLWAPDLPGLFVAAARALAEAISGAPVATPAGERVGPRPLSVLARDRHALLVAWLNELVALAELEGAVFTATRIIALDDHALHAEVEGTPIRGPSVAVKAATFHGLEIRPERGGLAATVLLDV